MFPGFIINSTVSQIKLSKKNWRGSKIAVFAQVYRKCVNHECFLDDTYLLKVNTLKTPKLKKKLHPQPATKSKYLNTPNVLILKFHLEVNTVCYFMLESTQVDSVIPVLCS